VNKVVFVGGLLARARLKRLLTGPGFSPIGEAATLVEARRWLRTAQAEDQRAQLLLMYSEGRLDDEEEEMLRAIRRDQLAVKVVILGDPVSLGLLAQACPTEIDGYLLNDVSAAGLMRALDLIMSGRRILLPSRCATLGAPPTRETAIGAKATTGLSAQETQVLQLLVVGSSNKAIARDLGISREVVKVHMKSLLRKLKARNRPLAAVWGHENENE